MIQKNRKEELVSFCRENSIPVSGVKTEIADRIAYFLDTGKVLPAKTTRKKSTTISAISEDTEIEADFVCSERHRAEKQQLISSLSTIPIFETFLQTIKESHWRKQLSVGNTKSSYKDIIAMKEQTL